MNKILVVDETIESLELDSSIKCVLIPKNSLFEVNTLKIDIIKNCDLNIFYNILKESKLNIEINILDNIICNINEFREGIKNKVRYHYVVNSNSNLNIYKFYDIQTIKEFVQIDLNGINAKINYNFKTISKESEKYDLTIYHNSPNTNSNIINNGINIKDGNLIFNVSSFVSIDNIKCNVIQNSRIINLTDNKCIICPNLYIDEYDVSASHSAHIGSFKEDEIFYLMSRGITKKRADILLIKGFLTHNMNSLLPKIEKTVNKYWR